MRKFRNTRVHVSFGTSERYVCEARKVQKEIEAFSKQDKDEELRSEEKVGKGGE